MSQIPSAYLHTNTAVNNIIIYHSNSTILNCDTKKKNCCDIIISSNIIDVIDLHGRGPVEGWRVGSP